MTSEEQDAVLQAAADKLAENMADLLEGLLQEATLEDIGYAAVKEYLGFERDQVPSLTAHLDDGILHINAAYLLPTPIEYIKINLLGGCS